MKNKAILVAGVVVTITTSALAQTVTAFDLRNGGRFLDFDASTPLTQNVIGTGTATTTRGMDFSADGSTLYSVDSPVAGGTGLNVINMADGSFLSSTTVTGMVAGDAVTGLTISSSGTAYLSGFGTVSNLYTLDLGTGVATLVGAINTSIVIDIAIDNQGNLFGMDIGTDDLWSIDTGTGAGTSIGAIGFNANFSQGMDFDPVSNTLFALIYTGGGTGQFATINTATGAATSLADMASLNGEYEMAIAAVPEPASMLALAAGAALIARRRKRK